MASEALPWINDPDRIEAAVVVLIYIQIGCSIVGSIGAMLNGVLLMNLVLSMFLLLFIEIRFLPFRKPYLAVLVSSILLDIVWISLFSQTIWEKPLPSPSERYEYKTVITLKLTLAMQVVSFIVRSLFSVLLIGMHRLQRSMVEQDQHEVGLFHPRFNFIESDSSFASASSPFSSRVDRLRTRSMPCLGGAGRVAVGKSSRSRMAADIL